MNISMGYICFNEWCKTQGVSLNKTQNDFRVSVIKQIVAEVGKSLQPKRRGSTADSIQRLNARHYPSKIQSEKKTTSRSCKVCLPAQRRLDNAVGVKRKCMGHESLFECKNCNVTLC